VASTDGDMLSFVVRFSCCYLRFDDFTANVVTVRPLAVKSFKNQF